jgi:cell division transport system permease protein
LSVAAASGWIPAYSVNLAGYCWRCWRARALVWLGTVVAVGAILALAANAELFVVLAQRGLSAQMQSASEFQVFLADGAQPAQVTALQQQINGLQGVRSTRYRSKEEALGVAKRSGDAAVAATANGSDNPIPASIVVNLQNPGAVDRVTAAASASPATDHQVPTSYTPSQAHRLSTALSLAQAVVVGIGLAALGVACLVGLALVRGELRARKAELEILVLVGTPRPIIRLPVFVEAVSVAVVGTAIATATLLLVGVRVVPAVNSALPFLQLGSAVQATSTIALATLLSSVVALGACSLMVRLPR